MSGTVYLPKSADVTHERLDGEVIAVHLGSGCYYSMVGPAADLWWLICHGVPSDMWPPTLAASFASGSVDPESFEPFIDACLAAGLIAAAPESARPTPAVESLPEDYVRTAWTTPVLEEFTDLKDLILVDPVHDTTDRGWPYVEGERGDDARS